MVTRANTARRVSIEVFVMFLRMYGHFNFIFFKNLPELGLHGTRTTDLSFPRRDLNRSVTNVLREKVVIDRYLKTVRIVCIVSSIVEVSHNDLPLFSSELISIPTFCLI